MGSTDGAKAAVVLASGGSAVIIALCLISVGVLFNDINSFYDEVMTDMQEFKTYANDAWRDMVYVQGKIPAGENTNIHLSKNSFASLVGVRIRRAAYGGSPYNQGVTGGQQATGGDQCSRLFFSLIRM